MITVLVVDDEREVRTMLYLMLINEGYEVLRASNGREAIETYQTSPADVVVTDLRMPDMDGFEVVRLIKQWDEDVAAIILTAYGELDNALAAFQSVGVCNYLTKPLESPETLIDAVQEALRKRQLSLQNRQLVARLGAANSKLEVEVASRTTALIKSNQLLSEELQRRKKSEGNLTRTRRDIEQRTKKRMAKLVDLNQQLLEQIRDYRRMETRLRKSELKAKAQTLELDRLYRSAPVGWCILDQGLKILRANEAMAGIMAKRLDELMGRVLAEVHPGLAKQLRPVCRRVLSTGQPVPSHMIRMTRHNIVHSAAYWLASSYPMIVGDGVGATSHIFHDISGLRLAQKHIRQSKVMLQAVFDGISDPLIMVDRNLIIRMLNKAARHYFGISEYSELIGKTCTMGFNGQSKCEQGQIDQAVTAGRELVFERQGFMDQSKIEKVTVYPLSQSTAGFDGSIIKIVDITEIKKIERQVVRNERLASLEMLVAGVAHEINNPNNFITFNIPILKSYLEAILANVSDEAKRGTAKDWFGMSFNQFQKEVHSLIGNLEHGAIRIADIVTNLRALTRTSAGGKTRNHCNIAKIIGHVETLVRSEIESRVATFRVKYPEDLPMMMMDREALEQILINLLINASHAANKSDGVIELLVKLEKDTNIEFAVKDNGIGMDEETARRIFDPFFTTMDPGRGIGLGLYVCHNLVQGMGGGLQVETTLNEGSVFKVILPIELDEEAAAAITPSADPSGRCSTGQMPETKSAQGSRT